HQEIRAVLVHGEVHLRCQPLLPGAARFHDGDGPHPAARQRLARRSLLVLSDVPELGAELRAQPRPGDQALRRIQLPALPALFVGRRLRIPERQPRLLPDDHRVPDLRALSRTVTSPHAVREIEHAWIPLSDGARLAAALCLPQDAERAPVPALLEYLPYRKRDGTVE